MRTVVFLALVAAAAMLPVANAGAGTPADTAIGNQIGQRLRESGRLRNYRIGVKYEEGVVWLEGTVASAAQRETAIGLTQKMPGVVHVISHLDIADTAATMGGSSAGPQGSSNLSAAFENADAGSLNGGGGTLPISATMNRQYSSPSQQQAINQAVGQPAARTAGNMPVPMGRMAARPTAGPAGGAGMQAGYQGPAGGDGMAMAPMPAAYVPGGGARAASYDNAQMPGYAWPSYAAYPNYAALTYPQQYSPTAWPYIGPFYPYPQVPLAWRKVSLEWDDGWWFLDFSAHNSSQ